MSAKPAQPLSSPAGSTGASSACPGWGMALSLRASAAPVMAAGAVPCASGAGWQAPSSGMGGRAAPWNPTWSRSAGR